MKFIKFILTTLIILGGIGYGIYYFGSNLVANKVMDAVVVELEDSGQLDQIRQIVNNDPEIQRFIQDGANVDESKLPFKTKEEATRVIIQKIGMNELQDIQANYQNGMSTDEILEALSVIEGKLTSEEILALKVLAYKELNK